MSSTMFQSFAQTLPSDRSTDWSLAGAEIQINPDFPIVNFVDEGGVGDGTTLNNSILNNLISSFEGSGVIIFFPAGDYLFSNTIFLTSNIILRGASAEESILLFDNGGFGSLISISGQINSETINVTEDVQKDDFLLKVDSNAIIQPESYYMISEDDSHLVFSDWAINSTGQINRAESLNEDVITFRSPFRRDFEVNRDAQIRRLNPIRNVGIENLTIERLDETEDQTSNIIFNYALNCWVKCIKSYNSNFAHVEVSYSTNINVDGSYFQDGFNYGSGGQGYGVVLQYASGECLVYNNIFKHLRHAMLLQAGANGNVVAYNFSRDPFWTDVLSPSNSAGDLVLHGNYPYLNLLEGNTVQNIVIDNSHGINGPYNTIFRNRAQLYGIIMSNNPASNHQNFLGNEVSNNNFLLGNYLLAGVGHFQFGNNVKGTIIPGGTNSFLEESLYFDEQPEYPPTSYWPLIGIPNMLNDNQTDAQIRFNDDELTACSESIISSSQPLDEFVRIVKVYPNPTRNVIHFDLSELDHLHVERIEITSSDGKLMDVMDYSDEVDLTNYPRG